MNAQQFTDALLDICEIADIKAEDITINLVIIQNGVGLITADNITLELDITTSIMTMRGDITPYDSSLD